MSEGLFQYCHPDPRVEKFVRDNLEWRKSAYPPILIPTLRNADPTNVLCKCTFPACDCQTNRAFCVPCGNADCCEDVEFQP